ncbi:MAG: lysozyme inhibitor LprI family protein [Synechococcaceae cyanobacterium]|nr:lysozyme inhibitor LprI family protein [Synechococcaceae cyanobacterium]
MARSPHHRRAPGPLGLAVVALVGLALPSATRASGSAGSPCAEATTTLAMTECLLGEVRRADLVVERYLRRSQQRLDREGGEALRPPLPQEPRIDLAATQRLWLAYRQAHCGDTARRWRGASLRPVVTAECLLRLSKARSRELWHAYLTFPDGTAPLLPDPEAAAAAPLSGPKR